MKNQKHHFLFLLLAVVFLSLSSFDSHAAETDSACTLKVDGTDYYDYAFQVLELVNEQREAAGLGSLTMDSTLLDCAMQRAAELSVYFSHTRPDGRSCITVMGDFNYTYQVMAAENIACGQVSPDGVMTSWMNSDGHKANILRASATAIGIGCFRQSNGYYCWVQLFSGNTSISEAVKPADCDISSTVSYAAGYLGNISVTPASSSLTAGNTTTLTVKLTNAGFSYCKTILQPDTLSFSSSAPEVISVDSSGEVKAISCGSAVITVTLPDGTKAESEILSKHITVTDKAVAATCTKTGLTEGSHCSVCGKVIKAQTVVPMKSHTVKTTVTKATTTKNGSIVKKCSVCGKTISKTTIYYPKTIKLSTTRYTYDGKVKKPSVTVKDSAGKTISSSNYTLTWSAGRKNVGKYSVKITFKGNYSSSVTKTFTIVPKKTAISSAVNVTGRKITIKWKKNTTGSGYQIQYSTSSKFTNAKTITVSKNTTVSKTITNLTKSKKYYIRIRTYKTVSGKKYYSDWSSSKYVTIKK